MPDRSQGAETSGQFYGPEDLPPQALVDDSLEMRDLKRKAPNMMIDDPEFEGPSEAAEILQTEIPQGGNQIRMADLSHENAY